MVGHLLRNRMQSLRMSDDAMARRTGLPVETVRAILNQPRTASPENISAVVEQLGLHGDGSEIVSARQFRRQAAFRKARLVASLVQGTMGLEAQALDQESHDRLIRQSVGRLLRMPEKLW